MGGPFVMSSLKYDNSIHHMPSHTDNFWGQEFVTISRNGILSH